MDEPRRRSSARPPSSSAAMPAPLLGEATYSSVPTLISVPSKASMATVRSAYVNISHPPPESPTSDRDRSNSEHIATYSPELHPMDGVFTLPPEPLGESQLDSVLTRVCMLKERVLGPVLYQNRFPELTSTDFSSSSLVTDLLPLLTQHVSESSELTVSQSMLSITRDFVMRVLTAGLRKEESSGSLHDEEKLDGVLYALACNDVVSSEEDMLKPIAQRGWQREPIPGGETDAKGVLIPTVLFELQIAVEYALRLLEESGQLDIHGAYSEVAYFCNFLSCTIEVAVNQILVPGPGIVELNPSAQHSRMQNSLDQLPVVTFVPLDTLLKSVHGNDIDVARERSIRLLTFYSQSWLCAAVKGRLLLSTQQLKATADLSLTGRCLCFQATQLVPINNFQGDDWYVCGARDGVRVMSGEDLERKATKVRKRALADACPLKGQPSTLLLLACMTFAWLCGVTFTNDRVTRSLVFPLASVMSLVLVDELGYIQWMASGDFKIKAASLVPHLRSKVQLAETSKVIHEAASPRHAYLLKLIYRVLPVVMVLSLLWVGWANNFRNERNLTIANWANFVCAFITTALVLILWPGWSDLFPSLRTPSETVAYMGRSLNTEITPVERFVWWSGKQSPFSILPTYRDIYVFKDKHPSSIISSFHFASLSRKGILLR